MYPLNRLPLIAILLAAVALLPAPVCGQEEEEARPKKPVTTTPPKADPSSPRRVSSANLKLGLAVSLADEAKKAEHPALKKILEDFAQIHDTIITQSGTIYKVQPIPVRFDPQGDGSIAFTQTTSGATRQSVSREQIRTFSHYEFRALDEVKKLVESGLDQPGSNGVPPVTRFRLLQVGEWVLNDAARFHASAKDQKQRTGKGWDGVDAQLKAEIGKLQQGQVRALTTAGDYQAAEELGAHLLSKEKGSREILDVIEKLFMAQAEEAIAKKAYFQAREHLESLMKNYNSEVTPAVQRLQRVLEDRARELVAQSDAAEAQKKGNRALLLLEEAQRTWPRLEGLAEKRFRIAKAYPTLRIGVRSLPTQMSPTTAETDVDRLAVRLIFDRLMDLRGGPSARDGYAYKLGPAPQAIPGGWEFVLPRDIQWSDGKPFTVKDVVRSFEIVKDHRSPYYNPLLKEQDLIRIEPVDEYRFTVTLKQGHLDPMSLLTCELLPAHLLLPDRTPCNLAFGKAPVGTGPYVYQGVEGKEAIFVANPNYKRPHAPDGPQIKEIRLVQYGDIQEARQALANGTLHLVTDFGTKDLEALSGITRVDLLTPTEPKEPVVPYLSNGRVYWLVPNYRHKALQNLHLRQAISGAIDREKILNEVFRGKDRKFHQALNGPFPLNSWAYNPSLTPARDNPYQPDEAKSTAAEAKKALGNLPVLTLKYSAGDPSAAAVCQQLETQLKVIGVKLKLEAVPYQQLVAELAGDRPTFDLLYWAHDFEDETLNLWPLFDPYGIGSKGRNFMGFEKDSGVEGRFRDLQQHRDFSFIREKTQMLHEFMIRERMTTIPLWQLDRHVAVHRNLRPTRLHPVWLVDDIEEWELRAGE